MNKKLPIIVTGAAGFIGSCMVQFLNDNGYENLVLVDDFSAPFKLNYISGKKYTELIGREELAAWFDADAPHVAFVIHLGAKTDTTEFDYDVHQRLNVDYSIFLWRICAAKNIPLIYASSAATYGAGEFGYVDSHELVDSLRPLNPYGISKNEFDKWALRQAATPPFWAGLKFFNVYGPNEAQKGRMASVVWHAYNQLNETGCVKLFKSHRPGFLDGQQLRDFVYVKDLLQIMYWMMLSMADESWDEGDNGLYNIGTGEARSFFDLASAVFKGLGKETNITFIDMPEDIRDKYQYFTEANINKLRAVGYKRKFYSLEEGVGEYVTEYLACGKYF